MTHSGDRTKMDHVVMLPDGQALGRFGLSDPLGPVPVVFASMFTLAEAQTIAAQYGQGAHAQCRDENVMRAPGR